jgi:hypothetical protein
MSKITKVKIGVNIDQEILDLVLVHKLNKSKLINWLLANYYAEEGEILGL